LDYGDAWITVTLVDYGDAWITVRITVTLGITVTLA